MLQGDIVRWSLPLKKYLPGCPEGMREGLLVRLADGRNSGVGECSPLPGFSVETLAEAQQALTDCVEQLVAGKVSPASVSESGLQACLGRYPSSVTFAVEAAVEQLLDISSTVSVAQNTCGVCRLLAGHSQQVLQQAENLPSKTRLVKVKVGRQSLADDITLLQKLDKCLPTSIMIRLDGNRCWTLQQALSFARHIPRDRVSFIEEPLALPELTLSDASEGPGYVEPLHNYVVAGGLPVALDESLQWRYSGCGASPQWFPGLAALVIKPTLAGGVHRCRMLASFACRHQLELVISSSYESPVGISYLQHLSTELAPETPPGLDTLSIFQRSTMELAVPSSLPELTQIWSSNDCCI